MLLHEQATLTVSLSEHWPALEISTLVAPMTKPDLILGHGLATRPKGHSQVAGTNANDTRRPPQLLLTSAGASPCQNQSRSRRARRP